MANAGQADRVLLVTPAKQLQNIIKNKKFRDQWIIDQADSYSVADEHIRHNQYKLVIYDARQGQGIGLIHFSKSSEQSKATSHRVVIIEPDMLDQVNLSNFDLVLSGSSELVQLQLEQFLKLMKSHVNHPDKAQPSSHERLIISSIIQNVRHELATPLLQVKAAIANLSEVGVETVSLDLGQKALNRLEMVITNISMLGSSIETEMAPYVLKEIIEAARRQLERTHPDKEIASRIRINIPANLPIVMLDRNGIITVIRLLVENALKFSHDQVEITARRMNTRVLISIHDHGIGIEAEDFSRIFDPFVQLDASSTRAYGGAGIGLTLVKLILDEHNSHINVESKTGVGSIFSFTLDCANFDEIE